MLATRGVDWPRRRPPCVHLRHHAPRIDTVAADNAELDTRIEQMIAPHTDAVNTLDEITGVGLRSA